MEYCEEIGSSGSYEGENLNSILTTVEGQKARLLAIFEKFEEKVMVAE
jgi:hypothetical protein